MIPAAVSKLNNYIGDPAYDRLREEFDAAQEEGVLDLEFDVSRLDNEIRLDFMAALVDLGYDVGYSADDEILEVWFE